MYVLTLEPKNHGTLYLIDDESWHEDRMSAMLLFTKKEAETLKEQLDPFTQDRETGWGCRTKIHKLTEEEVRERIEFDQREYNCVRAKLEVLSKSIHKTLAELDL